ncbi:RNA polymerase sigma factor [Cytobacillus oceanisediminis]|uniref:RNA polymerase sigma factor n=1 Tax=Cytobacillus oceanisediminis TaxID=665099 RepID=UPI00254D7C7D|nr:RNA polymerase sigma factor [Cytobacillus oceanisediminis]MDK7669160.1 RNA polymerase sigma factor [Cytobacillus oceanisediminis]
MPEDQELIKEILRGSQAAMEVLTRKYYKPIYAFVYRKVGNRDTAYDLTQEIFIKMIQRIESYSSKGSFKSWLYQVAVNHCRDYWRSSEYKQTSKHAELLDTIKCEQKSVPYIFERKEMREQVKQAIHSLPDIQREAVILKYFHHMKIQEIAVVTQANVSTVKSRLKQGLSKIAASLERGEKSEKKRIRK